MNKSSAVRKTKHLVLVGGGHAHVEVLRRWKMRGLADVQLTVISPSSETLYSGMLPGLIAGRYGEKEVVLDLHYLAQQAGALLVRDQVVSLIPGERKLALAERPPIHYDVVSFDIGSRTKTPEFLPDSPRILATRPFPVLLEKLAVWDRDVAARRQHIVAAGSGAAGFELILALRARYRNTNCFFSIIDASGRLTSLQQRILRREGVEIVGGREVVGVKEAGSGQMRLFLAGGEFISADKLLWAAGPAAHGVFSGVATQDGYLTVNSYLQSVDDTRIFGAGDCVAHRENPWVERAGVYAVREAPILFHNLLSAISHTGSFKKYSPQRNYLKLLNTSGGDAILDRKPFHFSARWAWHLKDYIDQKFMDKYRPKRVAPMPDPDCGGCGGKVSGDTLCTVLSEINPKHKEAADDVAVMDFQGGKLAATVDEFKDFGVDPYLFGKIAAVGAASDLYAKGLKPQYALSLVQMPKLGGGIGEDFLAHFLAGARGVFASEGIQIVGGQTNESDAWRGGFSLFGAGEESFWPKGPPKAGDVLMLTKPIGSGVILAAAMQEVNVGKELDLCLAEMQKSAAPASAVLKNHTVSAATDVTGFSLLGHLREMLEKGEVGAALDWRQIPQYSGALELFRAGYRSRMNAMNERAFGVSGITGDEKILYTPETAGGLLFAIPENEAAAVLKELKGAAVIGKVTSGKEIQLIR